MNFIPVEPEHVTFVAGHMREEDRNEVWASGHLLPIQALEESIAVSRCPQTLILAGKPAGICGVSSIPEYPTVGVPWMLGTDRIRKNPREFMQASSGWVQKARSEWDYLINYTDARAVRTHRWLEWLGFRLFEPEPFGIESMPFRRFEMRKP